MRLSVVRALSIAMHTARPSDMTLAVAVPIARGLDSALKDKL